ncbi:MAG: hypothetical protein J6D45_06365 [Clostridia bacterium]|nr:hypothetical protein [Clostridia bacterium]
MNILKKNKRAIRTVAVTLILIIIVFLLRDVIVPSLAVKALPYLTVEQKYTFYDRIVEEVPGFKYDFLDFMIANSVESPADITQTYENGQISNRLYHASDSTYAYMKYMSLIQVRPQYIKELNDKYFYVVLKSVRSDNYFWHNYAFYKRSDEGNEAYSYTGIFLCVPPVFKHSHEARERIDELYSKNTSDVWRERSDLWYQYVLGYDGNHIFGAPYTDVQIDTNNPDRPFTQYHLLKDCILRMDVAPDGSMLGYELIEDEEFFPECYDELKEIIAEIRQKPLKDR